MHLFIFCRKRKDYFILEARKTSLDIYLTWTSPTCDRTNALPFLSYEQITHCKKHTCTHTHTRAHTYTVSWNERKQQWEGDTLTLSHKSTWQLSRLGACALRLLTVLTLRATWWPMRSWCHVKTCPVFSITNRLLVTWTILQLCFVCFMGTSCIHTYVIIGINLINRWVPSFGTSSAPAVDVTPFIYRWG